MHAKRENPSRQTSLALTQIGPRSLAIRRAFSPVLLAERCCCPASTRRGAPMHTHSKITKHHIQGPMAPGVSCGQRPATPRTARKQPLGARCCIASTPVGEGKRAVRYGGAAVTRASKGWPRLQRGTGACLVAIASGRSLSGWESGVLDLRPEVTVTISARGREHGSVLPKNTESLKKRGPADQVRAAGRGAFEELRSNVWRWRGT